MLMRRKKTRVFCIFIASVIAIYILLKSTVLPSDDRYKQTLKLLKTNEQYRGRSSNRAVRAHCKPRKNIVFVKTHKTGSSTVTNILHRHGDKNNLVFGLPRPGQYRLNWPWTMQNTSFEHISGTQPNIICYHGRYDRAMLEKLVPRDTVYVTILRHPIIQYDSTFKYMAFEKLLRIENTTSPLEYFLSKPKEILVNYLLTEDLRVDSDRLKLIQNGMCFDLGLNSTYFDDEMQTKEFIRMLKKQFDLVMIAEFFDESIMLLKDLLCWPLEELSYFNLNVRHNKSRANFSKKTIESMRRWNNVDFRIYHQFREILLRKIARKTQKHRFHAELEELRRMNNGLRNLCLRNVTKTKIVRYGGIVMNKMELNGGLEPGVREMCDQMRRNEVDYITLLREKQMGFFEFMFFVRVRHSLSNFLRFLLRYVTYAP